MVKPQPFNAYIPTALNQSLNIAHSKMQKHQPFGWIAKGMRLYAVKAIECNTVFIDDGCENRSLGAYFNDGFTFADGTPFGIKEE